MPLPPIDDYLLKLPDPTDAFRKNLEAATGVAQVQQRGELYAAQAQEALAQAREREQKMAMEQRLQADIAGLGDNPAPSQVAMLMLRNPHASDKIKPAFEGLAAEEKKASIAQGAPILSALINGSPETAIQHAEEIATGLENSGQVAKAQGLRDVVKRIKEDQASATLALSGSLSAVMGAAEFKAAFHDMTMLADERRVKKAEATEKESDARFADRKNAAAAAKDVAAAADNYSQITDRTVRQGISERETRLKEEAAPFEIEKAKAETENYRSMAAERPEDLAIKKEQLAIDRAKLAADVAKARGAASKLSETGEKELNKTVEGMIEDHKSLTEISSLANRFGRLSSSGWGARNVEAWKKFWGSQDGGTQTRLAYERFQASAVVKLLPPGPASDRDIEIVRKGFPPADAKPEHVASFLRGLEKLKRIDLDIKRAKADWLSENVGSMGKASRDFTAAGKPVKSGESFFEFQQRQLAPAAAKSGWTQDKDAELEALEGVK